MKIRWLFIAFIAFLLIGCGGTSGAGIEVEEAWTRSTSMQSGQSGEGMEQNGAAYMILNNRGDRADKLLRAESDVARAVELHLSEMKDGVMSMHPVEFIEIPAKGNVELKPGGLHIMLVGLQRELMVDEKISITLFFENAGQIQVDAEVRTP